MDRSQAKEEELKFLSQEYKKNPELFSRETFIDSPEFLETIGISLKEYENLPKGYFKLWPYDFIVEEISKDGTVETVNSDDFFHTKKPYSKDDPTAYATLVKCKFSTFEAANQLSDILDIDKKKTQFAGIKDTDALTAQQMSFRGINIEKLQAISSPHFFLKNVYSSNGALEVGSLKGNKFTILIRTSESFDKEEFNSKIEKIRKNGFYNFFYSQRFGSPRFVNWFWGLLILRGGYRNAVLSFLCTEGQREIQYFKNLRSEIKSHIDDWDKILELIQPFPLVLSNEIKIIKYLQKNPKDFVGALKQLPEQIQMWVFAYGSLLFNRKLSEYIENKLPIPEKLPLILSKDQDDWIPYYNFLKEDQISSMPLKNLQPFSDIQWKKREIKTTEQVDIHKVAFVPEGIILSFSLSKGCYATTFLSHLFQLSTGLPPKNISEKIIDTKEILGDGSLKDLMEKFKDITFSKSEDYFDKTE